MIVYYQTKLILQNCKFKNTAPIQSLNGNNDNTSICRLLTLTHVSMSLCNLVKEGLPRRVQLNKYNEKFPFFFFFLCKFGGDFDIILAYLGQRQACHQNEVYVYFFIDNQTHRHIHEHHSKVNIYRSIAVQVSKHNGKTVLTVVICYTPLLTKCYSNFRSDVKIVDLNSLCHSRYEITLEYVNICKIL